MDTGQKRERVAWIDAAKAIGIFMIYIGHYSEASGLFYPYVFQFHVAFLFFLAGCTERIAPHSWGESWKKATQRLLIPFFLFGLAFLGVRGILLNSWEDLPSELVKLAQGAVRNQFSGYSLWFLTCLWVMEMVFPLVQGWKARWLMLLAIGIQILVTRVLPYNPTQDPQVWYNADSALAYSVYFLGGYVSYPWIARGLEEKRYLAIRHGAGVLSLAWGAITFWTEGQIVTELAGRLRGFETWGRPIHILILICSAIYAAWLLQELPGLRRAGRESLYLCGNENGMGLAVPALAETVGLHIQLGNPLGALAYGAAMMALGVWVVIPAEKRIGTAVKRSLGIAGGQK